MSRITGGITVSGLEETIAAASAAEKDIKLAILREIRRELRPMADDVKNRFRELGGTGPRVATTVRASVGGKTAKISMGSAKHPYSLGREFGAKRNQTRPFFRRVQSGPFASRRAGGGERRVQTARIPYSSERIFGSWTGNQFDFGESGDRLTIKQTSGRAYYPAIGAGAVKVWERLSKVADRYVEALPPPAASPAQSGPSPSERLAGLLSAGGIEV